MLSNSTRPLMAAFGFVLLAVPSAADAAAPTGLAGTLSGDYSNSSYSGGGGHVNTWGANAAGAFGIGMPDVGGEIDGSYHHLSLSGANANLWGIGGSAFWAPGYGRFGLNVTYTKADFGGALSGLDAHVTTYGGFGEFYVSNVVTIGAKAGGADGTASISGFGSGSASGGYVGGELTGYAMPNLAIKGSVDYLDVSGSHVTSYGIAAEYLFSETTPISIFGGYVRGDLSNGAGHVDNWMVGLKFYTDGPAPLVTHHRTGTLGSVATPTGLKFAF